MKQKALAAELGISQQSVSQLEQSETIEEEKLREISMALGVTPEALKNFNEEAVFNIIGNNYHYQSSSLNYNCTFNPLDKLIESYEENKKLYERLVQAEKDKVKYLEELMKKGK